MKVLIDTHVLLWALEDETKLSSRVQKLPPAADVCISVASLREILAKVLVGKLTLPMPVGEYLTTKSKASGVSVLSITFDHGKRLEQLPLHHRDPFDRILMAQSLGESLRLITDNPQFAKYPVPTNLVV
jgi:PIN domain nuclease of toxin-antitoxin system